MRFKRKSPVYYNDPFERLFTLFVCSSWAANKELKRLSTLNPEEPYDLIFIDAQKSGYPSYLRDILAGSQPGSTNRLLRPGGIIIADNVLRRGLVADGSEDNPNWQLQRHVVHAEEDLAALREFNKALANHERLEALLLPVFDGVGFARLLD